MDTDILDLKAIQMLNKLLKAAQKAHATGKQQALSKIIHTASQLSSRLNESSDDTARNRFDDIEILFEDEMIDTDYYTRVEGVLID